jgi:hypothetical protein
MNVQQWLTRLLASPAAEPLDWESYQVTMDRDTWTALWRDIDGLHAYEDGLEAGLRLLLATERHRAALGERTYQANQVRLCRTLLAMLDKGGRWEAYLAAWEAIWTHTHHCLPLRGDSLLDAGARIAPFVRRADGNFGVPPLSYGAPAPKTIAVHFLYPQLGRKTLIERKVGQGRTGTQGTEPRAVAPDALTTEQIQARLAGIWASAG